MHPTLLLPKVSFPAIEERYAVWQSALLLRQGSLHSHVIEYDPRLDASEILKTVSTDLVIVATDPLVVSPHAIGDALARAMGDHPAATVAVPATNESRNLIQRRAPGTPYLTLRQFEEASKAIAAEPDLRIETIWDSSDPGLFVARTSHLRERSQRFAEALNGSPAVVVTNAYVHRYSSHRGQLRGDLLELVPKESMAILEFGCGEAALGGALKERQECRVVGMELDPDAAAIARTRVDLVVSGDARDLVTTLGETFDFIVGGDILEHIDDPWTFLSELRKVTKPGGRLLLSLPNIAAWPIVEDLLRGRFDYVYMGITCAGHVRFFTKKTIAEMLMISGWTAVAITPQPSFITPAQLELEEKLDAAGIVHSKEDLLTPGYYVMAERVDGAGA